jgi:hypothetical protein
MGRRLQKKSSWFVDISRQKALVQAVEADRISLRPIINSFAPYSLLSDPGCPQDEYDSFIDRAISAIQRGVDAKELATLMFDEFCCSFDVEKTPEYEVLCREGAEKILTWWHRESKLRRMVTSKPSSD